MYRHALCMLSYSTCLEINNSLALDKVLCDGDTLYQSIINRLKADGTFIHALLSLDEVPNVFEVSIGKFTVEKQPILSGPRQANLVLIAYASSEGSGEPAHPRSLARTFAARSYKQ